LYFEEIVYNTYNTMITHNTQTMNMSKSSKID